MALRSKVLGGVTPYISFCLARLTRADISGAHWAACFPLDLEEGPFLILVKMLIELKFEALIFKALHLGPFHQEIFVGQRRS
jgi:hypothetical protein